MFFSRLCQSVIDRIKKQVETGFSVADERILKKLPDDHPLRVFAMRVADSIQKRNLALALGIQDFSDGSAVKSAIRELRLRVHPDKNMDEQKDVATKLWIILSEIESYLKRQ